MSVTLGVTCMALQVVTTKRSICTANKLQVLKKMNVTYKWNVTWSCSLYHRVCHEKGHLLLGKFFLGFYHWILSSLRKMCL